MFKSNYAPVLQTPSLHVITDKLNDIKLTAMRRDGPSFTTQSMVFTCS